MTGYVSNITVMKHIHSIKNSHERENIGEDSGIIWDHRGIGRRARCNSGLEAGLRSGIRGIRETGAGYGSRLARTAQRITYNGCDTPAAPGVDAAILPLLPRV